MNGIDGRNSRHTVGFLNKYDEFERYKENASTYVIENVCGYDSLYQVMSNRQNYNHPQQSDLVKGEYEGGLKVWECSLDLIQVLISDRVLQSDMKTLSILELGCGHALPMISHVQKHGNASAECQVMFHDYNEEVLRDVTFPNVAINLGSEFVLNQSQFIHGSWRAVEKYIVENNCTFDLVLAAETVYDKSQLHAFSRCLLESLYRSNLSMNGDGSVSKAYVAGKRFYFGVGGGMFEFCQVLQDVFRSQKVSEWTLRAMNSPDARKYEIHVETLVSIEDGTSNIRDIIQVWISQ
uniref:protein-histidine N-methyltransferase n=1 Tax=Timspurckia oligopyrenoides TaxID=708627 RepID=A0A7S1EPR3_9RHOD